MTYVNQARTIINNTLELSGNRKINQTTNQHQTKNVRIKGLKTQERLINRNRCVRKLTSAGKMGTKETGTGMQSKPKQNINVPEGTSLHRRKQFNRGGREEVQVEDMELGRDVTREGQAEQFMGEGGIQGADDG